jgi:hypothetical protein
LSKVPEPTALLPGAPELVVEVALFFFEPHPAASTANATTTRSIAAMRMCLFILWWFSFPPELVG